MYFNFFAQQHDCGYADTIPVHTLILEGQIHNINWVLFIYFNFFNYFSSDNKKQFKGF